MKIFLVRHGESADDLDDSYGGAADFELTDTGRDQARAVGAQLKSQPISAIFSSPLRRAREAAEIIAGELGTNLTPTVVPDLRERNSYGVLSGLPKDRAKEIFGYILDSLQEKPGYSREPLLGAEDFDDFISRVRHAFESVTREAAAAGHEQIAIITHGKFTQGLFEEVLNIDKDVYLDLSAVNVIDYEPPAARVDLETIPQPVSL